MPNNVDAHVEVDNLDLTEDQRDVLLRCVTAKILGWMIETVTKDHSKKTSYVWMLTTLHGIYKQQAEVVYGGLIPEEGSNTALHRKARLKLDGNESGTQICDLLKKWKGLDVPVDDNADVPVDENASIAEQQERVGDPDAVRRFPEFRKMEILRLTRELDGNQRENDKVIMNRSICLLNYESADEVFNNYCQVYDIIQRRTLHRFQIVEKDTSGGMDVFPNGAAIPHTLKELKRVQKKIKKKIKLMKRLEKESSHQAVAATRKRRHNDDNLVLRLPKRPHLTSTSGQATVEATNATGAYMENFTTEDQMDGSVTFLNQDSMIHAGTEAQKKSEASGRRVTSRAPLRMPPGQPFRSSIPVRQNSTSRFQNPFRRPLGQTSTSTALTSSLRCPPTSSTRETGLSATSDTLRRKGTEASSLVQAPFTSLLQPQLQQTSTRAVPTSSLRCPLTSSTREAALSATSDSLRRNGADASSSVQASSTNFFQPQLELRLLQALRTILARPDEDAYAFGEEEREQCAKNDMLVYKAAKEVSKSVHQPSHTLPSKVTKVRSSGRESYDSEKAPDEEEPKKATASDKANCIIMDQMNGSVTFLNQDTIQVHVGTEAQKKSQSNGRRDVSDQRAPLAAPARVTSRAPFRIPPAQPFRSSITVRPESGFRFQNPFRRPLTHRSTPTTATSSLCYPLTTSTRDACLSSTSDSLRRKGSTPVPESFTKPQLAKLPESSRASSNRAQETSRSRIPLPVTKRSKIPTYSDNTEKLLNPISSDEDNENMEFSNWKRARLEKMNK